MTGVLSIAFDSQRPRGVPRRVREVQSGISFGYSGENICSYGGQSDPYAVLDWCHSTFMAEPYPGYANHKGNILGAHVRRMGVGVAQVGSKVIVVWDFTD